MWFVGYVLGRRKIKKSVETEDQNMFGMFDNDKLAVGQQWEVVGRVIF